MFFITEFNNSMFSVLLISVFVAISLHVIIMLLLIMFMSQNLVIIPKSLSLFNNLRLKTNSPTRSFLLSKLFSESEKQELSMISLLVII